jgi:hypothetical protein
MTANADLVKSVVSFVRGEASVGAITSRGVGVSVTSEMVKISLPPDTPRAAVTVEDVLAGLESNSRDAGSLRVWATVVLASALVDLPVDEDSEDFDMLLDALWDAMDGRPASNADLENMRRRLLAASETRRPE